jgi:hypothetical protein
MSTRPYELLARYGNDGTVAGVSVRTITTVGDRDYEGGPVPLADATDPAFKQFAELFAADAVAELTELRIERDALTEQLKEAKQRGDALQAEVDRLMSRPTASTVTRRQARLALLQADLLDAAEATVKQAGRVAEITYESETWNRNDPVLIQLAGVLGITDEQLDELFALASTL